MSKDAKEIIKDILSDWPNGIHRNSTKILLLSGQFRNAKTPKDIIDNLKKLNEANVLLQKHEDILFAIRQSTDKTFRIDAGHNHHENNPNITINLSFGSFNFSCSPDSLLDESRKIEKRLRELDVDYSLLISWLVKEAKC